MALEMRTPPDRLLEMGDDWLQVMLAASDHRRAETNKARDRARRRRR